MLCHCSKPLHTVHASSVRILQWTHLIPYHTALRTHTAVVRADRLDSEQVPPPPPPPPPPYDSVRASATPRFQDLTWQEFKEIYLRPNYLPVSFTVGALTLGLRVAAANYTFDNSPFEFLATAASTGVMCMILAWVLFDFTDSPPPGGNFSSPRK